MQCCVNEKEQKVQPSTTPKYTTQRQQAEIESAAQCQKADIESAAQQQQAGVMLRQRSTKRGALACRYGKQRRPRSKIHCQQSNPGRHSGSK
jgi:hypothetical protein